MASGKTNSSLQRELNKILIVDDDDLVRSALESVFGDDYAVVSAASGVDAVAVARSQRDIACVIMDIKMSGMDGFAAARALRELNPTLPVIFHTGFPGDYSESEIESEERPFDYIVKGESVTRLFRSVRNAVDTYRLRASAGQQSESYGMIGRSAPMRDVFALILTAAGNETRVMIRGETGTGKELVARAIHQHSRRADKRLAILNCNHKAADLVESELFGHVRGAFTGAVADRTGLFEYAHGGTIFLDEIGDLDITTQAKLLRVLESGEFQRIGEPCLRMSDARVICATHRDLEEQVKTGKFREDLYYRLKGLTIALPPLRERRDDIPLLAQRLAERIGAACGVAGKVLDASAIAALVEYDWPGNVRQLQNVVESALLLTTSDLIVAADIKRQLPGSGANVSASRQLRGRIRELERSLIIAALAEANFRVADAAAILGIDTSNLHKKIKQYEINVDALRP